MIKIVVRQVKPAEEQTLRQWLAELKNRHAEVRETFAQEGVLHEQAYLLATSDGPKDADTLAKATATDSLRGLA